MIERINLSSVNNHGSKKPAQSQPQFKGLGDGVLQAVQMCEQIPMLNVTVLDVATAIGPRTIYESQTNAFAGLEAFRRESSGLVVNCLLPGALVLGAAKLLEKPLMGATSKMGSCWADEETIKTVAKYWQAAEGEGDAKIKNTYASIIKDMHGVDGKETIQFKDKYAQIEQSVEDLTNATIKTGKEAAQHKKNAFKLISEHTNVTEHINIGTGEKVYTGKLGSIVEEAPKLIKEFIKNNITETKDIEKFISKSTKLVTAKSLLGLGVIIPLAISMQPINRWITAKTSGKKGAPIYKDFKDSQVKELTKDEKAGLLKQKMISVGSMVAVAMLSVMKKPNMAMLKELTQFKGIFPTMDQARLISTATFASRMMASEDKNDLREATVRDISTFSAFYFLGDYVAKGIATGMQKVNPKFKLINVLKKADDKANPLQKFWHWAKHTSLKSTDEIADAATKKMRSVCQLGNIGFSLLALGVLIPMITRKKTDKQHAEDMKKAGVDKATIDKFYPPHFMMNSANQQNKDHVFKAFFTSNK